MLFKLDLFTLELFLLLIKLHLILVVFLGRIVKVGAVILKVLWAVSAMRVQLALGLTVMMCLREVEDEVWRLGRGILDLMLVRLDMLLAVTGLLADPCWRGHGLLNYRSVLIDDGVGSVTPRGHIHVLQDSLSDALTRNC